jgi:hypothetical protein
MTIVVNISLHIAIEAQALVSLSEFAAGINALRTKKKMPDLKCDLLVKSWKIIMTLHMYLHHNFLSFGHIFSHKSSQIKKPLPLSAKPAAL